MAFFYGNSVSVICAEGRDPGYHRALRGGAINDIIVGTGDARFLSDAAASIAKVVCESGLPPAVEARLDPEERKLIWVDLINTRTRESESIKLGFDEPADTPGDQDVDLVQSHFRCPQGESCEFASYQCDVFRLVRWPRRHNG